MSDPDAPSAAAAKLRENIALIERRRREEATTAAWPTRLGHRIGYMAGSMRFVAAHAIVVVIWVAINHGFVPDVRPFDPAFIGLGTTASVEAIFLTAFVLISQNRLAAADERRADLDLHVNLLAEHELTRLAVLVERIAERLGLPADVRDLGEVKRDVEPAQVLDTLDRSRTSG